MKILRKGKDYPEQFKHICRNCDCKFIVEKGDYTIKQNMFCGELFIFKCPYCKKELQASALDKKKRYKEKKQNGKKTKDF